MKKKPRRIILRQEGKHHNLRDIYARINEEYFEGRLDLDITWYGNPSFKPKSRIVLGSYNSRLELIKIHRHLDQAHIPHHYVSFIVYHEMLHHVSPPIQKRGRRKVHHGDFKQKEKVFADYHLAKEFDVQLKEQLFGVR
ncbi:MAG: hypothetical protein JSR58_05505 [Verrucomicrobia bacterium]|nr:hypothetical protein [Verrucomicrobiota bacterium]